LELLEKRVSDLASTLRLKFEPCANLQTDLIADCDEVIVDGDEIESKVRPPSVNVKNINMRTPMTLSKQETKIAQERLGKIEFAEFLGTETQSLPLGMLPKKYLFSVIKTLGLPV
jgi:hypothetical protein